MGLTKKKEKNLEQKNAGVIGPQGRTGDPGDEREKD
ncbi:MAG: hypothetical protein RI957_243 [Verrucomicrobiota bacterium]|jgi:hypothetical protein